MSFGRVEVVSFGRVSGEFWEGDSGDAEDDGSGEMGRVEVVRWGGW